MTTTKKQATDTIGTVGNNAAGKKHETILAKACLKRKG